MRAGPWQWVVLFFTRPVRVSDSGRARAPVQAPRKAGRSDCSAGDRGSRGAAVAATRRRAGIGRSRPRVVSLRAQPLEVGGVSEQPLDTLPAELQSVFRSSSKAALDPPRSGAGGAES